MSRSTLSHACRSPRSRFAPIATATLLGVIVLPLVSAPARAQPAAPADWPCVQVLVPEISPSVLWPVPIDPGVADSWRKEPGARALAERLGDLERVDAAVLEAMDDYAASLPEAERREGLTRLADGVVDVANDRRGTYLDGIRRYTRQQIAIAGQIESTLNRLAELDDAAEASAAEEAARVEVEETLAWHERLYDQRERAIRALCERPVELEETLSEVLRELAYRLPDA